MGVLNLALTLERLEADFYQQVLASDILEDGSLLDLVREFARTESVHVRTVHAAVVRMGGRPVAPPASDFEPVLTRGPGAILKTALVLENTGAAAYLGGLGHISDRGVLATALSIHSVEARHAAALGRLSPKGLSAALPDGALARPLSRRAALDAIIPFLA